jgi:hypothetical protein
MWVIGIAVALVAVYCALAAALDEADTNLHDY